MRVLATLLAGAATAAAAPVLAAAQTAPTPAYFNAARTRRR